MSAFDVAGAVVWTPLAVMFWLAWGNLVKRDKPGQTSVFFCNVMLSLASAYCIARLSGFD